MKQPTKRQIISAFQGFFVLTVKTEDGSEYPVGAYREPIIGWQIDDGSDQPIPLTPSGAYFETLDILYPDGTVNNPVGAVYENIDSWLKDKQSRFNDSQGVAK
jgi:hypothetical protein